MSDWMPGALKKPITKHFRDRTGGTKVNALVYHIAVSEASSLYGFFSGAGVCSHFYVRRDGTIEQYLPMSSKSKSEKNGNNRTASVETQGGGSQQSWTEAQVRSLAAIATFANQGHGVPLSLMPNSHTGTHGVGYHRLGIDGNFPSDALFGGRQQRGGGELWTNSLGKTCPDNSARPPDSISRIAQIPGIITLASGSGVQIPPTNPGVPTVGYGLDTDGWWGNHTTFALQDYLSTPEDGEIWRQSAEWADDNPGLTGGWVWNGKAKDGGSPVVHALWAHLRAKGIPASVLGADDGKIGPKHITGLQRYVGTAEDGELWDESPCIEKVQARLNAGTF